MTPTMTTDTTMPVLPKPHKDRTVEGISAKWMAKVTGGNSHGWAQLAKKVADQLSPGSVVLDVATGPGYFCIELAKLGYAASGIDLSHTLVEIARKKAVEAGVSVDFREGSASSMPFADDTFDFLLCRGAFKNFGEPVRALQEMYRVLKPGGRGVIYDLSRDVPRQSLNRAIDTWKLPLVNRVLTKFFFQFFVRKAAYTKAEFQTLFAQTKFPRVEIELNDVQFNISMWK